MNQETWTIHTDGASRGNPGAAAFAYVIQVPGESPVEVKSRLPDTTNNVAEYTALVKALEHALQLGAKNVQIKTDSELMVRQLEGIYKVKNEGLKPLFDQARHLRSRFQEFHIQHVPRKLNKEADRLCNEALDQKPEGPRGIGKPPSKTSQSMEISPLDIMRKRALLAFQDARENWSAGDIHHPTPLELWQEIWDSLEELGLVKAH